MALFFGGVPTGPDVDALMREFPPAPGLVVSHEEVARVIGVDRSAARFRTVTNVWRGRVFRERLLQSRVVGGNFEFMTADAAQDQARGGFGRIGRAIGRHRVRVEAINPADLGTDARRDAHNLLRREATALHDAARSAAKQIALPAPGKRSLPVPDATS